MIPNEPARDVQSNAVGRTGMYGISRVDEAHLLSILRDTLYTDKILAVLREYGANAWDAHRDAGKSDVPIQVTLATFAEPTLRIRDFGKGLSPSDVFDIYTQYGASTKRSSDNSVGMLGIGSKSAFAYADSFTVTSFHGGKKTVYIAALDVTNKGVINQMWEEDCGDETGVEIQVSVRSPDITIFEARAKSLFAHFTPRPVINTTLPPEPKYRLKSGTLDLDDDSGNGYYSNTGLWTAVMGCVPYRVNLAQLTGKVSEVLTRFNGTLTFSIGEVTVSASREELKYSDETKAALVAKFEAIIEEHVVSSLADIGRQDLTPWERRTACARLFHFEKSLPKEVADRVDRSASIGPLIPAGVLLQRGSHGHAVTRIEVSPHTRVLWHNGPKNRKLKGYDLAMNDYIVVCGTEDEFTALLATWGVTGVTTGKLAELPWTPEFKKASSSSGAYRVSRAQHRKRCFQLLPGPSRKARSENWDAVSRVPEATDVYAVLRGFVPEDEAFVTRMRWVTRVFALLGRTVPPIYGYKTTDAKPVDRAALVGVSFTQWYDALCRELYTPAVEQRLVEFHYATSLGNKLTSNSWYLSQLTAPHSAEITATLGADHPVAQRVAEACAALLAEDRRESLDAVFAEMFSEQLRDKGGIVREQGHADGEVLRKKYPLLSEWRNLWADNTLKHWLEYIQLKDAQ